MKYWFIGQYERIKRMIYWAWVMRDSYDYCATTTYEAIYHKLDRVYKYNRDCGHLMWNSDETNNQMRKLNEARILAKRLNEWESHERHAVDIMSRFKSNEERRRLGIFSDLFPNAKPIDSKLYNFYFMAAHEKDSKRYQQSKARLFYLLNKYIDVWWD